MQANFPVYFLSFFVLFFSKDQENSDELNKENSDPQIDENAAASSSTSTPMDEKRKKQPKIQHIVSCNMCDAIFKKNKMLIDHKVTFHSVSRRFLETKSKRKVSSEYDEDNAGRFVSSNPKRKRPM